MDTDSHKQRMQDIQKRKAERRKKQIFKNRCIAAVFCVLVLALLVFGIKSCVSGVIKRAEERKAAQVTPTPVPTNTPIPKDASGIAQDFFKKSAFVGNSFIDGMVIYDLVDGADYFSKIGLNVKTATTESTENGSVPVIEELNSTKVYEKIFMMFGENEVGWPNSETFVSQYKTLVKKAKQYQPEAKIYLLSITPITQEESDKEIDGTTNDNIRKFNKLIKRVAQEEDVTYCDIYSAVVNSDGALPKDAASDGIHFGNEYYKKCLIYIQEHYGDGNSDNGTASENSSSSDESSSSGNSSSSGSSSSGSTNKSSSSGSSSSGSSSSGSTNKSSSSGSTNKSGSSSSGSSSSGSTNKSSSSGSSSSSGNTSSGSSSSGSTSSGNSSSSGSTSSSGSSSSGSSSNAAPSKSLDD